MIATDAHVPHSFRAFHALVAPPTASTRTFRDGFIVADRVERRTETATPDTDAESSRTSTAPALRNEAEDGDASKAPTTAAPAAIHVSGADAHTTTIKMEGGDEITIKRGASSKNKITTISTHEDGKITIENHDEAADGAVASTAAVTPTPAPLKQAGGASVVGAASPNNDPVPVPVAKTRSVDFVGAYDDAETDADPQAAVDSDDMGDNDVPRAATATTDAGDSTHAIVVGKKKVTIVSVGRSETTVSLADVDDVAPVAAEEATAGKKVSTSSR